MNHAKMLCQIDEIVSVLQIVLEDIGKFVVDLGNCLSGKQLVDNMDPDGSDLSEMEYEEHEDENIQRGSWEQFEEQEIDEEFEDEKHGWGENLPHGYEEIEYPQDDQNIYDDLTGVRCI